MTKRKKGNRRAVKKSAPAANAFYVYCIGRASDLSPHFMRALPDSLEPGSKVELLTAASGARQTAASVLAAVASPVPLSEYAQDKLEVRLTDPAWTATRAMRHEKVVQHFASAISVIPLRFGAIYLDRGRVHKLLRERGKELLAVLRQLDGREEWGVNVYCDESKLRAGILRSSPKAIELSREAARASPGQSYLARKRIDKAGAEEARREIERVVNTIESGLGAASDAGKRLRSLKMEAGEQGKMVGRFAFLVPRQRFEKFQKAAGKLVKTCEPAGFSLELTGPWPAYNFTQR